MRYSIRLGSIAGIEIGIHSSWLIAVVLITWTLAEGALPATFGGWTRITYWLAGAASALLLFGSILVHEMAHSLMARSRGIPVKSITLFILGGASNLGAEAKNARDEFFVAIVGPATSVTLGALCLLIFSVMSPPRLEDSGPVGGVLFYLGYINVLVGFFNLIPGYPLDGGRVLRSVVWGATGSMVKATDVATGVGRMVAFLMIVAGLIVTVSGEFLSGIWIAFIGFFLLGAAEETRREVRMRLRFAGMKISDIMDRHPVVVSHAMNVEDLLRNYFIRSGHRAAVVLENDRPAGIVTLTDIQRAGSRDWRHTPIADVMTNKALITSRPSDPVESAIQTMAEHNVKQVLVVEAGTVVGMLTRESIARFLSLPEEPRGRRGAA